MRKVYATVHAIWQNREHRRKISFTLVGVFVLLLSFIMLGVFVEIYAFNEFWAGTLTAFISIQINFMLNRITSWSDRTGSLLTMWGKYQLTRWPSFFVTRILYGALLAWGIHYMLCAVLMNAIVIFYNYLTNDRFVFRKTGSGYDT